MQHELFPDPPGAVRPIALGAVILPQFAAVPGLVAEVMAVAAEAPFRRMTTPGGRVIGVEMTSCGAQGWISDRGGYRYVAQDPLTGRPWPAIPAGWLELAGRAAALAGFPGFVPDSCLINRYAPGVRMGLHQDRDEADLGAPIVSVSLGLGAEFQFGGPRRSDPVRRHRLEHGDVVVWGGPARLAWHGVPKVLPGQHPQTGATRLNLTFRKAGPPAAAR